MKCASNVVFLGVTNYFSEKTQKNYPSILVVGDDNENQEISFSSQNLEIVDQIKTLKRLDYINVSFNLKTGQYTKLTLLSVDKVKQS